MDRILGNYNSIFHHLVGRSFQECGIFWKGYIVFAN